MTISSGNNRKVVLFFLLSCLLFSVYYIIYEIRNFHIKKDLFNQQQELFTSAKFLQRYLTNDTIVRFFGTGNEPLAYSRYFMVQYALAPKIVPMNNILTDKIIVYEKCIDTKDSVLIANKYSLEYEKPPLAVYRKK